MFFTWKSKLCQNCHERLRNNEQRTFVGAYMYASMQKQSIDVKNISFTLKEKKSFDCFGGMDLS